MCGRSDRASWSAGALRRDVARVALVLNWFGTSRRIIVTLAVLFVVVSRVVEYGAACVSPMWSVGRLASLVVLLPLIRLSARAMAGFESKPAGMIVTTVAWIAGMILYGKGVEFLVQRACHQ